jgi:catechol 2,3-dioxygenase-like lactoylglutathione lyase family enzyme
MAVQLNHTIVHARDAEKTAAFWSEIFGLPAPRRFSHFHVVDAANGVSLDLIDTEGAIDARHFAFLVSDPEFDQIFGRIRKRGIPYWADPARAKPGEINHHFGGRGVYFVDPNGHFLEIITRPYGSGE